MKVFAKIILLCVLTAGSLKADPMDNYIADAEYGMENEYEGLGEFTPRSLDETDTQGAGLTSTEEDSLNDISSPVDAATISDLEAVASGTDNGLINIDTDSEAEHNRNYVRISTDLKAYEDAYKACLANVSDSDFSQELVEKCVGVDYQFVYDDIDFEKRKILSRADNTIRTAMITICYNAAGADLVMDNACDLIQKDALELMWNELNFEIVIEYHREKYIFVHAKLPEATFTPVINRFKDIYGELSHLIEELYAHRDLTIMRIKRDVDERTALIAEKFQYQEGHPVPKIKKDVITIDEVLIDQPGYHLDLDNMVRPMIENGQDQMYAMDTNPWVESFAQNVGPDNYASINGEYVAPDFNPPTIFSDEYRKRHLAGTPGPVNVQNRTMRSVPVVYRGGRSAARLNQNKIRVNSNSMVRVRRASPMRRMRVAGRPQTVQRRAVVRPIRNHL